MQTSTPALWFLIDACVSGWNFRNLQICLLGDCIQKFVDSKLDHNKNFMHFVTRQLLFQLSIHSSLVVALINFQLSIFLSSAFLAMLFDRRD